jgi:hypothetical protein
MGELFGQVMKIPQVLQPLRKSNKIVQIRLTDPSAVLTLDGRSDPPRFFAGSANGLVPDVSIRLPADVLHNVWLGKASLTEAYFGGKIKLEKGNPLSALALWNNLSSLFTEVGKDYPDILSQHGLS